MTWFNEMLAQWDAGAPDHEVPAPSTTRPSVALALLGAT
jgi:hypothetical protein